MIARRRAAPISYGDPEIVRTHLLPVCSLQRTKRADPVGANNCLDNIPCIKRRLEVAPIHDVIKP
jgi:hypothetical protein